MAKAKKIKTTKEKLEDFFDKNEEQKIIGEPTIEEVPEPVVEEVPEPVVIVDEESKIEVEPVGQSVSRMMRRMGK